MLRRNHAGAPANSMMRLLPLAAALGLLAVSPASSEPITEFEVTAEGCSGGGDVCGTFPLIPSGTAEYEHSASRDGSLEVESSTSGGLPIAMCLPAACPPGRYHAEALAIASAEMDVAAGASAAAVAVSYRLDELEAETNPTIGDPQAILSGAVGVTASSSALCSDGSAITGSMERTFDEATALGAAEMTTIVRCAGDGATLPATRIRVELSLFVSTTSDGGDATAEARAQLVSVEIDAA